MQAVGSRGPCCGCLAEQPRACGRPHPPPSPGLLVPSKLLTTIASKIACEEDLLKELPVLFSHNSFTLTACCFPSATPTDVARRASPNRKIGNFRPLSSLSATFCFGARPSILTSFETLLAQ